MHLMSFLRTLIQNYAGFQITLVAVKKKPPQFRAQGDLHKAFCLRVRMHYAVCLKSGKETWEWKMALGVAGCLSPFKNDELAISIDTPSTRSIIL